MDKKQEYTEVEKEQALDDFELFLFNMDDILDVFIEKAAQDGYSLDYSLGSLDTLESYMVSIDAKPKTEFHGQSSQYLGETVRRIFGGHWQLSLDMKENSLHYGKPVIVGYSKYNVEFPPYERMATFLRRRIPGLLKQAVLIDVNPEPLDLNELPTEE